MTALTVAWLGLAGAALSVLVSFLTAKLTLSKEIEKMMLQWERDDIVSSEEEFAEMAASVAKYVDKNVSSYKSDAVVHIAAIRAKENGELASLLDNLYHVTLKGEHAKVDSALTAVIENKRTKVQNYIIDDGKSK